MLLTRQPDLINNPKPMTWDYWQWGVPPLLRLTAIMCCSHGHVCTLSPRRHEIHKSGNVTPSAVCPFECDFHEFVTLEGWFENAIVP